MIDIREWVPGLRPPPTSLAPADLAGIVLTALLVPQGMAYAELAGLPPITGLYTTILCLLGYALFGPSRILVLGPDSSLGPMIAATLLPIIGSGGDPKRAIALASALALLVGAMTIAGGGRQARLRRRPDLEAHHHRLHERPRGHDPCGPASQAVRLLGRGRRAIARAEGLRPRASPTATPCRRGAGGRRVSASP